MAKLSKRERWARETGRPKEEYPGSKRKKGGDFKLDTRRFEDLSRRLGEAQRITPGETAAQQQLDALLQSETLGLAKTAEQAIASPFVRGQQAGIQRQTLAKQQPLQQRLARLQAERQSAADVLRAQLGAETTRLGFQTQQQQFAAQQEAQRRAEQFQQQQFAEQQRQFNLQQALARQKEARIGAGGASSDQAIFNALLGGTATAPTPQRTPGLTSRSTFNYGALNFGGGLNFGRRP